MYKQVYDPVADSLGWSTVFAVLPLLALFILLGGLRLKAQWAALLSLAVAIVVAIAVYSMPVGQTLDAGAEGAVFGLFPIMWIVVNAIWIYNMTVDSGHFAVLRRSFASVSDDQRIQAILIAFCFGALMEALAGFGTPVAISAVMLIGLGFKPVKAATLALVANTCPRTISARWSAARRRSWRSSSRSSSSGWSMVAAACARRGRRRSSAAWPSPSASSPAPTTCRSN